MHPLMMNALDPKAQARLARRLGLADTAAPRLSRRLVLQGLGGAGLVLGFGLPDRAASAAGLAAESSGNGPLAPNPFLRIGADNLVTVVCKHHEMGQGNLTGLTALVAEELDADWAQMRSEAAPSDASRYNNLEFGPMQGTGGSSAISNSYLQYRSAALRPGRCSSPPPPTPESPGGGDHGVQGNARPSLGSAPASARWPKRRASSRCRRSRP
jgi:isoquinoline 1-oxidoreductase beta subunit